MKKLKAHLWSMPRWFAVPLFASSILLGSVLAGGINRDAWLAVIVGLFLMAGDHSMNSFLDYVVGLDSGEKENRSAEKSYTGGQNLIANGTVSLPEVMANAAGWWLLSLIPMYLISDVTWPVWVVWGLSLAVPFLYTAGKFTSWGLHEFSLGAGVGPVAVLLGAFVVNPNPPLVNCLLVGAPVAIILSFLGLSLDEWPDAEANLKKGVKSLAFKVWEYSEWTMIGVATTETGFTVNRVKSLSTLRWYCTAWLMVLCVYHVLLINLGVLKPMTAIALAIIPVVIALLLLLSWNFRKAMLILIAVSALYPILMLLGEVFG